MKNECTGNYKNTCEGCRALMKNGKCFQGNKLVKQVRHRCVFCKELLAEPKIVFASDPYDFEINDNDTKVWACIECRESRAGDV